MTEHDLVDFESDYRRGRRRQIAAIEAGAVASHRVTTNDNPSWTWSAG